MFNTTEIIEITAIIVAIICIVIAYVTSKHQLRSKKVGVEKSSGQIQQVEKASTVIQNQTNYLSSDTTSKTRTIEEPKPKPETVKPEAHELNPEDALQAIQIRTETKLITLLSDNSVVDLNIENDWLTHLYGEAYSKVIDTYADAKLTNLAIQVYPYNDVGKRVTIYFHFYDKWSNRLCVYAYRERKQQIELSEDMHLKGNDKRHVFTTLPWNKSPDWKRFMKLAYVKMGRFSEKRYAMYHVIVSSNQEEYPRWSIMFDCDSAGLTRKFRWTGYGLDRPEENIEEYN